jgi:hypothetical protein
VGVGTSTPTEKLEIRDGSLQLTATGGTAQPTSVGISNNSGSLNLALAASDGQYSDLAQAGDAVLRTNGKRLLLAGSDGGSVLVSTGPSGSETERLRVSTAGNVGIGTAADASQKLEVAGNVKISGSSNGTGNGIIFPDGSVQTTAGDNLGNHTATQNLNLAGYQLVSGGSTGLTLTSAGNVGVGTGAPTSTLQVNGSVAASIRTLSSGTIAATDYTVLVTGNLSLPTPDASNAGRLYHLLNGGAGSPTVTGTFHDAGSAGTFPSFTLGTGTGGKGLTVQSDGTQWWVLTRE